MDVVAFNRHAWNKQVEAGNRWTIPVSPETIAAARRGEWEIILTPLIPVPKAWYPEIKECDVLCLASGGGQQGPILAAAGAHVTVFDNSPNQLAQDRFVAEREGFTIKTVQGDMADLSIFPNESFDLIIHPCSNVFAPDVRPVWKEAYRVLRPGGSLLSGFTNPVIYIFDDHLMDQGILEVKHSLPYSDLTSLSEEKKQHFFESGRPLEFGHTLDDQIGGQIDAGFLIAGFYEDKFPQPDTLSAYMPIFMATLAIKVAGDRGEAPIHQSAARIH